MTAFCTEHKMTIYIGEMGGVHLWNCSACQATLGGPSPTVAAEEDAELRHARARITTAENLYLWTQDTYYLDRAVQARAYAGRIEERVAKRLRGAK